MKLKKIILTLLVTLTLGAPIAEVTTNVVQAAEENQSAENNSNNNDNQTFQVSTNTIPVQNEQLFNESKIGVGKGAKYAIKIALKNKNRLINAVGRVAGRKAAVKTGAALRKITPLFRRLLKWEDLSFDAVQDQIANVLMASGMNHGAARSLAFWIREGLELFV